MATFSAALRHVKEHLDRLVPEDQVRQLCRDLGYRWRDRVLGPAVTVQLFLLQLLARVSMRGVGRVAELSVTAQAVCAAKMRLPLALLMELVRRSAPAASSAGGGGGPTTWRGLPVYVADGTGVLAQDAAPVAGRYGKAKNQRGTGWGYPNPKLLALFDLEGGFVRRIIALPWHRQEFTCLARLFKALGRGALALGDRGLASFAHLALLLDQGAHGCFRLSRGQVVFGRGRASRRRVRPLGRQDVLVRWQSGGRRPGWMSKTRWAALAGRELTLRQIAFRVRRPGFRTHWAWIVTTLCDPVAYPAEELVELYGKRWQVEVCFRDLKRTLGMSLLSAKTLAGTRKEILAFVLLYNLIRAAMGRAAARQGGAADRVSFVDALRWLLWGTPGTPPPALAVNPVRRNRASPPRRVKSKGYQFPPLNGPRDELAKPPCEVML